MVVMRALVELEYRFPGFEMISMQQPGLLELREHAIHRCQSDIHILGQQDFIYILGTQMAHGTVLKDIEYLQARQGGFQAAGFQFGRITRHVVGRIGIICFII